jgi:hypothetical protein
VLRLWGTIRRPGYLQCGKCRHDGD